MSASAFGVILGKFYNSNDDFASARDGASNLSRFLFRDVAYRGIDHDGAPAREDAWRFSRGRLPDQFLRTKRNRFCAGRAVDDQRHGRLGESQVLCERLETYTLTGCFSTAQSCA